MQLFNALAAYLANAEVSTGHDDGVAAAAEADNAVFILWLVGERVSSLSIDLVALEGLFLAQL